MLEKLTFTMYGDYLCSCGCGCGKPLGHPGPLQSFKCIGIGDTADENGYEYRMFHPECWSRLKLDDVPLETIYETYPVSPENNSVSFDDYIPVD